MQVHLNLKLFNLCHLIVLDACFVDIAPCLQHGASNGMPRHQCESLLSLWNALGPICRRQAACLICEPGIQAGQYADGPSSPELQSASHEKVSTAVSSARASQDGWKELQNQLLSAQALMLEPCKTTADFSSTPAASIVNFLGV